MFAHLVVATAETTGMTESGNNYHEMFPFHQVVCSACIRYRGCIYYMYGHVVLAVEVCLGIGGMRQMNWDVVFVGIANGSSGEPVAVGLGLSC